MKDEKELDSLSKEELIKIVYDAPQRSDIPGFLIFGAALIGSFSVAITSYHENHSLLDEIIHSITPADSVLCFFVLILIVRVVYISLELNKNKRQQEALAVLLRKVNVIK